MIIESLPDIEFSRCIARIYVRSLSYIYIMDGVEELIPLEEYAETEMTENTEERRQNGINTIYQEIEWLREKKASE